jgi:hypothetical protein
VSVGTVLKTIGTDIVKGVEFLPKAEKVISSAIKDQPLVKNAILSLVAQGTKIVEDGSVAAAQKGVNLLADAATLADAEAFFAYFRATFIPIVESVYAEVKADVK